MDSLISQVHLDLSGSDITGGSLVRAGIALAVSVNKFESLKGSEKQELVVKTLLTFLDEKKKTALEGKQESQVKSIEIEYSVLETIVKHVLPVAIDAAVSASRGGLKLKKYVPRRLWSWGVCGASNALLLQNEMKKLAAVSDVPASAAPAPAPAPAVADPSSVGLVVRTVDETVVPAAAADAPVTAEEAVAEMKEPEVSEPSEEANPQK